jgi:hypothetical protein
MEIEYIAFHNKLNSSITYYNKKREKDGLELIPKYTRKEYMLLILGGKTPVEIEEELRNKYNYGKKTYCKSETILKKDIFSDFEEWKINIEKLDRKNKYSYLSTLRYVLRDRRNKRYKTEISEIKRKEHIIELEQKIEYLESLINQKM